MNTMKALVLSVFLISGIFYGQHRVDEIPFVGTKEFNFSGMGLCCNVMVNIDKKGTCKIYTSAKGLVYFGKYQPVMDKYKIYKKEHYVYVEMIDPKGELKKDCLDFNGNNIPCVFKL